MSFILGLIVNVVAVAVAAYLLSPHVILTDWYSTIVTALALGLVNTFIKPVLTLLTLPLNLITLGLFSIIINGLMILLVSTLVAGFEVQNFFWAIIFSVVLSVINSLLDMVTGA